MRIGPQVYHRALLKPPGNVSEIIEIALEITEEHLGSWWECVPFLNDGTEEVRGSLEGLRVSMAVGPKVNIENRDDDVSRKDDSSDLNPASINKLLQLLCTWSDL